MITRRAHEIGKQPLGEPVANHAFGVPLNTNNPIGVAVPLDASDRAVRRLRGHTWVLPPPIHHLVVAAVDRAGARTVQDLHSAARCKSGRVLDIASDGS